MLMLGPCIVVLGISLPLSALRKFETFALLFQLFGTDVYHPVREEPLWNLYIV